MGRYACLAVSQDIEGFILFFTMVQGWTRERVDAYITRLKHEMMSGQYHIYYMHKVVWGRKPLPDESQPS